MENVEMKELSIKLLRYGGIVDDYEGYDHLYMPVRIRTIVYDGALYNHYMRGGSLIKITKLITID